MGPVFSCRHEDVPMQWTTTVPMWPRCNPLDVMARLQTGITDTLQIERPWETPSRGRLRCRDSQLQKWVAYTALYVEREDRGKTAPHTHLVASRRAPPSISQPNRGHSNGDANVTPDDAAHGAARRHRSERERRLLRARRRAAGQLLVLSARPPTSPTMTSPIC
jgi:hypothetical protein